MMAWLALLSLAAAAERPAFQSLLLDPGARAEAMGGAHAALWEDAETVHYNPAGLAEPARTQASFFSEQRFGFAHHWLGLRHKRGLAVSFGALLSDSVPETTLFAPDGNGASNSASELAFAVGGGRSAGPVSIGAAVKSLHAAVAGVNATGFAADAGLLWKGPVLSAGFSAANLGPPVAFSGSTQKLPRTLRLGLAARVERATLAFDFVQRRGSGWDPAVGVEARLAGISARGGYAGLARSPTLGVGVPFGSARFDYATQLHPELGWTHRAGLTLSW